MKINNLILPLVLAIPFIIPGKLTGQTLAGDSTINNATLDQCIEYALKNQPAIKQALIDEEIGERDIKSALSGWLPQINGNANFNHNFKQQVSVFPVDGVPTNVTIGTKNTSLISVQANQNILNAGLIQASKTAKYFRQQFKQTTENNKIFTVVDVSKAFYDILTSREQLNITDENITRLQKQLKDAYAQYEGGLVDKTDYKRAQISLSNSQADKKRISELLKYKYAYLKQLIGYPGTANFSINANNTNMENEVLLDTTQQINYQNRVEYRQLTTQRELQRINTSYNKLAYLPTLSGFINYGENYLNDKVRNLYDTNYPSSVGGLTLSIPIFQGTRRTQEIRKAQLQERRADLDLVQAKNEIYSQTEAAMASYKANLNDWKTSRQNVTLSQEVYNTIKVQYDEGIKSYLELMTAETDLRTTQINYLNALYSLLSSKLDVQQALGTITFQQ
ncbi:TolC family protein [Arcticibacter eurypsychrophilus]|uniref:TolC family protein n=1 Tax=Arcticibacter eurypsychrophilus TaxID=1434752 RepID=UPI00084DEDF4|nr:TolC family protein [Arcticibacter eurypsychrophilus]